jgi:hypothetical protein
MTILDQAEQLRQQALSLLIQERETIDQKITQLGGAENRTDVKKDRKQKTCGQCGEVGHTIRTCKITPSGTT